MRTLDPRRPRDARRHARTLVCALVVLAALVPASAEAIIVTGGPVSIVDSTTPPTPAAPYPSQVNVPVGVGMVRDVNLRIDNLTHAFPSDVDALLVGPDGTSVLLLSDAGPSAAASNVDPILDDQAVGPAPDPLVSGTFLPTDLVEGFADLFPAPAPAGPYGSALAAFNETDPVGSWSLYLVDDDPEVSGSITGWRLILGERPRRALALPLTGLTAKEGQGSISVTVSRPAGGVATVGYAAVQSFANFPAISGRDFEPVSGTLSFAPGETSKTFTVPLVDDRRLEDDEEFAVELTSASGDAQLPVQPKQVVTIENDDPPPPPVLRARGLQRVLKARGVLVKASNREPVSLRATATIALPGRAGAAIRLRPARAEGAGRNPLFLRLPRRAEAKLRGAFARRPRLAARVVVTAKLLGLSSTARRKIVLRP
jgi:hypothetical protein